MVPYKIIDHKSSRCDSLFSLLSASFLLLFMSHLTLSLVMHGSAVVSSSWNPCHPVKTRMWFRDSWKEKQ